MLLNEFIMIFYKIISVFSFKSGVLGFWGFGVLGFYVWDLHWPAFNLADTAIFCGVALLLAWPGLKKTQTEQ